VTAGYDINLNIALKNSQKLMKLRKELVAVGKSQVYFNKQAKEGNEIAVATFNKLNKQLSRAKGLLNKAAYGTDSFKRAAQALVNVEKEHNHQLKERDRLLKNLRLNTRSPEQQAIRDRIIGRRAANFAATGTASSFPRSEGFLSFSKAADKIAAGVKANVKQTTKTAQILSQQATRTTFQDIGFGTKGGQAAAPSFWNNMGFGRNAQQGPFAMQGGAMGRLKGGVGSAMIGGGFPFLFGAGGLSAAMGGIAGGIGGALAPGGGFALSIAATAAAAQIEDAIKFRKELKIVNSQLQAVGNTSIFTRKEIKSLAKELNITKEEATQLIDSFVPRFTKDQTNFLLEVFGKGGPDQFDAIATASSVQSIIEQIIKARDIIGQQKVDSLLEDVKTKTNLEVILRLTEEIAKVRRKQKLEQLDPFPSIKGETFEDIINKDGNLQKFLQQLDPNSDLGKMLKDVGPDVTMLSELAREFGWGFRKNIEPLMRKEFFQFIKPLEKAIEKTKELAAETREYQFQLEELAEFKAPVYELERLMRPQRRIIELSKAMKSGFEDSFKGLIKGTMSVQDAFRNMFNRIADHYADMVAKMLATQIQKGFLNMFASLFDFGGFQFGKTNKASDYLGDVGNPFKAEGGPVSGGRSYIVGEEGPEIFTPGVSGGITPNHALGGSTNISVNIDASGTSVEGDEPNGEELGRLVAAAIQSELIKEKRPGGLLS